MLIFWISAHEAFYLFVYRELGLGVQIQKDASVSDSYATFLMAFFFLFLLILMCI